MATVLSASLQARSPRAAFRQQQRHGALRAAAVPRRRLGGFMGQGGSRLQPAAPLGGRVEAQKQKFGSFEELIQVGGSQGMFFWLPVATRGFAVCHPLHSSRANSHAGASWVEAKAGALAHPSTHTRPAPSFATTGLRPPGPGGGVRHMVRALCHDGAYARGEAAARLLGPVAGLESCACTAGRAHSAAAPQLPSFAQASWGPRFVRLQEVAPTLRGKVKFVKVGTVGGAVQQQCQPSASDPSTRIPIGAAREHASSAGSQ